MEIIERRTHPRKELELRIDYRSRILWQYKNGKNISEGGIFIETMNIEPPGTEVKLTIYFPDEPVGFEVEGEVVWNRPSEEKIDDRLYPPGMGIRFLKVPLRLKTKLEGLREEVKYDRAFNNDCRR